MTLMGSFPDTSRRLSVGLKKKISVKGRIEHFELALGHAYSCSRRLKETHPDALARYIFRHSR